MRLTVADVPEWAVQKGFSKLQDAGIPPRQSSLILYAIGRFIGIPDEKLMDFAVPRPGRKKMLQNPGSRYSACQAIPDQFVCEANDDSIPV